MKLKTVISVVLLLFVAISIVALIVKQSEDISSANTAQKAGRANQLLGDRLIVYYFHGNSRCPTCLTLEAYSKEAIETSFDNELKSGRIQWQVVNFDEIRNEHFLQDYGLSFQSLVLVEFKNGKEIRHKNLEKVWDLVGDKPAYLEYVKSEVAAHLSGSGS